jgi:Ca-activated chloride channel homolog
MNRKFSCSKKAAHATFSLLLFTLTACVSNNNTPSTGQGFPIKLLIGSDLGEFCDRAATKFNQTNPKLSNGQTYYLSCQAQGSGDAVKQTIDLAKQLKTGQIQAEDPNFPTLIVLDGEIYQNQLEYQMRSVFVGQNLIPSVTDSPLLAYSPMVLMTSKDLSNSLDKVDRPYSALAKAKTFKDLNPQSSPIPIKYAHTAPTRSNSGLQTLVAQYADLSGKPPESLTVADIVKYQKQIEAIQSKIVRYGKSTSTLTKSMVDNGVFWASIASVYESSVINANSQPNKTTEYRAIYPKATFTSNKRLILADAPWISAEEKEAAKTIIDYLRSSEIQQIAVELGLRPGVAGVPLGNKFSEAFGVKANPVYESYRSPTPAVVEAMLKNWQTFTKKASQVVLVVDTSGSMRGEKLANMQQTLLNYVNNLNEKDRLILISFNSVINQPVIIDRKNKDKAIAEIGNFTASGGTHLYDATLAAKNWLDRNYQNAAINAVIVMTDGQDDGSAYRMADLENQLKQNSLGGDRSIAFFTVGFGKEGEFDGDILAKIAKINGGYYRSGDPNTINSLMSDLQMEF